MKGLRFQTSKAGSIQELCCPPYDIISEEQRKAYLERNEHNVIRLELPKGDDPYGTAGRLLEEWIQQGILKREEKESLYIYEEEFTARGCLLYTSRIRRVRPPEKLDSPNGWTG